MLLLTYPMGYIIDTQNPSISTYDILYTDKSNVSYFFFLFFSISCHIQVCSIKKLFTRNLLLKSFYPKKYIHMYLHESYKTFNEHQKFLKKYSILSNQYYVTINI